LREVYITLFAIEIYLGCMQKKEVRGGSRVLKVGVHLVEKVEDKKSSIVGEVSRNSTILPKVKVHIIL